MIRIVLVGDSLSGKSTLFDTLLQNKTYESFCTTITPTYGKYLDKFILYDTPGQARWVDFAKPYVEVADAAIIVVDADHHGDDSIVHWRNHIQNNNRKNIPILIVANEKGNVSHQNSDMLYVNCKKQCEASAKLRPFLTSIQSDPKILIGWVNYVYLLLPSVEDVVDRMPSLQMPGCLQQ